MKKNRFSTIINGCKVFPLTASNSPFLKEINMTSPLLERARAMQDQIVAWRRDIHQHPELGFQEVRASRLVADTLPNFGLEVQTGVGKSGVVGYIGSDSGPVVGIRADMDALPFHEQTELPFAS